MKTKITLIFLFFCTVTIHSQSQINATTYADCLKQQFDSGLVDNLIYKYDVNFRLELFNITNALNDEEKKPISNQINEVEKLLNEYVNYLKSIPKLYPIEDKKIKKNVCTIWYESPNIYKKINSIREYCRPIYIEKEKKNYSIDRLSR